MDGVVDEVKALLVQLAVRGERGGRTEAMPGEEPCGCLRQTRVVPFPLHRYARKMAPAGASTSVGESEENKFCVDQ